MIDKPTNRDDLITDDVLAKLNGTEGVLFRQLGDIKFARQLGVDCIIVGIMPPDTKIRKNCSLTLDKLTILSSLYYPTDCNDEPYLNYMALIKKYYH